MTTLQSKYISTQSAAAFSVTSLIVFALYVRHEGTRQAKRFSQLDALLVAKKKEKSKKIAVDKVFLKRFIKLFKIIVPGIWSPEMGYALMVAGLLATRTSFDIIILQITTAIERAIISRSGKDFRHHLARFFLVMLPVSCVNSLLKYGHSELTLRFRTRLSTYLYQKYLSNFTYYQVSNLDSRISNADQLLTQDVERFCHSVSDLYTNITKPLLDIIVYAIKLSGAIGIQGPSTMLGYLLASGGFLTWLRQPTGRFTVAEAKSEGHFRFMNARLITHSEEIAFYDGNKREKQLLSRSFDRLIALIRKSQQFRYAMGVVDNIVAKYFATVVGFYVVSRPFLNLNHTRHQHTTHAERMEDYFRSGRMMIKLSEAMGRLVLSGRELTRLAGFTMRVTELMEVLKDLNMGVYKRTMVSSTNSITKKNESAKNKSKKHTNLPSSPSKKSSVVATAESLNLKPGDGTIQYKDHVIAFENVPLVTPNGDVLIEKLNFKVESGMNVVVCGPNGCGKSSLFRVLGELWPIFGGNLKKPSRKNLFYVPQRPYLTLGTLRDQVIYPHSLEQMKESNRTDEDLQYFLSLVELEYLVEREETQWDTIQDWADVLSGGEKQRIAMARLFYHQPQFAILDECTSAVSVDVEGTMYSHCREKGITLFTVSHRKSLWKHHEYVLQFDGRGKYQFKQIEAADEEFGS